MKGYNIAGYALIGTYPNGRGTSNPSCRFVDRRRRLTDMCT